MQTAHHFLIFTETMIFIDLLNVSRKCQRMWQEDFYFSNLKGQWDREHTFLGTSFLWSSCMIMYSKMMDGKGELFAKPETHTKASPAYFSFWNWTLKERVYLPNSFLFPFIFFQIGESVLESSLERKGKQGWQLKWKYRDGNLLTISGWIATL